MRPVRIELEGFSAFRDRTVVDFTDAELFAFVGATGSGKSSVIDGMIFALYGSVPRYQSENLVHPAISQGKPEAKVRLDFELGGETYSAVRVVRRTKTGASTKEARLEQRGDTVLADDPRGVQAAVTELLGLDLGQFTKCVVLPQGAFAQLLHDTSSKRQDLLVKLLDFGVYERIARRARSRVQDADQRLAVLDAQLAEVAGATDEAIASADQQRQAIDAVLVTLDDHESALGEIDAELRSIATRRAEVAARRGVLGSLAVPDGVDQVAGRVRDAAASASSAEAAEAAAAEDAEEADHARQALGEPARLLELIVAHERVVDRSERVETGQRMVAEQGQIDAAVQSTLTQADGAQADAEVAVEQARRDHAVAEVARHVHPGDDCPVCGASVVRVADVEDGALRSAEAVVAQARADAAGARDAATTSRTTLASLRDKLAERDGELQAARVLVDGAPDVAALRDQVAAIETAQRRLDEARSADRRARSVATAARQEFDAARSAEAGARQSFAVARDRLAGLGPPSTSDDLALDWKALVAWSGEHAAHLDAEDAALVRAHDTATTQRAEQTSAMQQVARDAGVSVTGERVRDACVAAAASASGRHEALVAQRDRAGTLRDEQGKVAEGRAVDDLLVKELHPRRFEAWLLEEALAGLVEGASARLEQLSSGRYALGLDDTAGFEVIDHANADERRLARTLSGGETFLASLALALALAERVSELSVTGQRTLDAIFLDEGFGTLDPDTLDVVASAIEELGASGRMVGVISHVRELAERVPVRFEVRRGADSSTVERIDA